MEKLTKEETDIFCMSFMIVRYLDLAYEDKSDTFKANEFARICRTPTNYLANKSPESYLSNGGNPRKVMAYIGELINSVT